jgi:glycine oxidase
VRAIEQTSGLACGLRQEGTLIAALNRDDEDEIARLVRFQERYGVAGQWLSADEALEREPHLSPRLTGALLLPDDHQVNPQATLMALERAVAALGGRIVTGATVIGFEIEGGRLRAVAGLIGPSRQPAPETQSRFAVQCEAAVVALGAWSSRDLVWPAAPLGIRPVKGQLLHLQGPDLIQHVVRTPQVYLVPRAGGQLVVGGTMEEQGFDSSATAGAVMDLLWNARLLLPGVYDLALTDGRVGFRPATRDHLPRIGETDVKGLYATIGHFRHGVLLAPAAATLLADILTGGAVSPLLAPFQFERAESAATREEATNRGTTSESQRVLTR